MKAYLWDEPCQVTLMFCYTTAKPDGNDEMTELGAELWDRRVFFFFHYFFYPHKYSASSRRREPLLKILQITQPCPGLQSLLAMLDSELKTKRGCMHLLRGASDNTLAYQTLIRERGGQKHMGRPSLSDLCTIMFESQQAQGTLGESWKRGECAWVQCETHLSNPSHMPEIVLGAGRTLGIS